MKKQPRTGTNGMFDRLFPTKYDFHKMLVDQADTTAAGTQALLSWLKKEIPSEQNDIEKKEESLDKMRHDMEITLMEAFSTPFDRRDIYTIAHQMGQILDFAISTYIEMEAFDVRPDDALIEMATALNTGAENFAKAIRAMEKDPASTESLVHGIRKSEHEIEIVYIDAMARVLKKSDPSEALRKREIYHHLKDAGRALSSTVDILHRIVVNIA